MPFSENEYGANCKLIKSHLGMLSARDEKEFPFAGSMLLIRQENPEDSSSVDKIET